MRTLPRILALAAALTIAAPAAPVLAQQPTKAQQQEAATRFKKGLELFKEGDYQAALIEFRRANELAPNFNVLYNIGQVYFQLQDYPGALSALQRYLDEGGNGIPAARRAEVTKDIEKLKARVANLEIASAVADAEVTIDDVVVGKTPLAKPILVSAGRHKVTISKTGFTPATKVVEIASAEKQTVHLDPVEQKVAPPVVTPPPPVVTPPPPVQTAPPPEPPPPPKSVPVAGIVVTGVLAAGAAVTGILALNSKGALQDEVKSPTATRDSLDSAKAKATGFGLATDILIGSAVVAAGVTLYVGLSGPSKKDAAPAAQQPASLPKVRVGVGPGSISLVGSF